MPHGVWLDATCPCYTRLSHKQRPAMGRGAQATSPPGKVPVSIMSRSPLCCTAYIQCMDLCREYYFAWNHTDSCAFVNIYTQNNQLSLLRYVPQVKMNAVLEPASVHLSSSVHLAPPLVFSGVPAKQFIKGEQILPFSRMCYMPGSIFKQNEKV